MKNKKALALLLTLTFMLPLGALGQEIDEETHIANLEELRRLDWLNQIDDAPTVEDIERRLGLYSSYPSMMEEILTEVFKGLNLYGVSAEELMQYFLTSYITAGQAFIGLDQIYRTSMAPPTLSPLMSKGGFAALMLGLEATKQYFIYPHFSETIKEINDWVGVASVWFLVFAPLYYDHLETSELLSLATDGSLGFLMTEWVAAELVAPLIHD